MNRFSSGIVISILLMLVLNGYSLLGTFDITDQTGNLVVGTASLCINQAPELDISACSAKIQQNSFYNCSATAIDLDNDTLVFSSVFLTNGTVFNITSWGYVEFTSNQSHVGDHEVNISVSDGSGCSNGVDWEVWSFTINDTNDPPILLTPIPNEQFTQGASVTFFLSSFFYDPDWPLDIPTYTRTITSNLQISISGDFVTIRSDAACDYTESVIFFIKDSYNESNESNIVSYTVQCAGTEGGIGGDEGSDGGISGPRGGVCIPELVCGSWEDCTPNGTQRRKCADLRQCDDVSIKYLYRDCKYIAHCFNDILDFDETGIDCGGADCEACATCFDNIQNRDEQGVDCGGAFCEPCDHCDNRVLDFDETGIDCGGADCNACPTCDDGIQNGLETGVDCGGNCDACTVIQDPSFIGERNFIPAIVGAILFLLVALLLTYRYYKKWLKKEWAKLMYKLVGSGRKYILLNEADRNNIIRLLSAIMEEHHEHKALKQHSVFDLISLLRTYYEKVFKVKHTINSENLFPKIDKKKIPTDLKKVLKSLFEKMELIEKGERKINIEEFEEMAEEFKETIFVTSMYHAHRGIARRREDLHKLKGKNKVYGLIHNALFALEFGDVDEALQVYMKLIEHYEAISVKDKSQVYKDVERLYKEILYAKRID